jgi:cell division protein FtsQ
MRRLIAGAAALMGSFAARGRRFRRWPRPLRRAMAVGALLLVLAGAGAWLVRSGRVGMIEQRLLTASAGLGLAVANVEVEGRQRASREVILSALEVERGMPILSFDPTEAKRRLERVPWVRSASIERRLPDTIRVRIAEREPLALWQRQGKLVLIDRDGVVVTSEQIERFGNLVVLVGPDAPKAGAALLDMLAGEAELATRVNAAVRVGGRRWNLRLDSGIDIALPEEDASSAWHRLAELERSEGILERDIQMVDLRLPDRLVVRATPAEPTPKSPAKKTRQPGKAT